MTYAYATKNDRNCQQTMVNLQETVKRQEITIKEKDEHNNLVLMIVVNKGVIPNLKDKVKESQNTTQNKSNEPK